MDQEDNVAEAALVAVSDDLIDELVTRGLVGELPGVRHTALDAVLTIGSSGLTVVTLLRDPLRVAAFARWLRAHVIERGTTMTITAHGGGSSVVFSISGATANEAITTFIASTLRESVRHHVDEPGASSPAAAVDDPSTEDVSTSVFVVHGRDEPLRDSIFDFLRALGLRPREWEEAVNLSGSSNPVLGTIPPMAMTAAQATVVLMSPDDVVYLHPDLCQRGVADPEARPQLQSRPNVLVELGMALAIHPTRTIILVIGDTRPIADLGGLNYVRLDSSPQALNKIANRLEVAGCKISRVGNDWMDTRRFSSLGTYSRQVPAVDPGVSP